MSIKPTIPSPIQLVKKDLNNISIYYEHSKNFKDHKDEHGNDHWVITLENKYYSALYYANDAEIFDLYVEVIQNRCSQKDYAEHIGRNVNYVHRIYKKMLTFFANTFYGANPNTPQTMSLKKF